MDFSGTGSLTMRYLNGPTGDLVDTVLGRESAAAQLRGIAPIGSGRSATSSITPDRSSITSITVRSAHSLANRTPPTAIALWALRRMERDTVTGSNLAVEREENPGTGRWDSQDPLGMDSPGPDLYEYANNDPSCLIGPTGLAPKAPKPLPVVQTHEGLRPSRPARRDRQ